MGFVFNPLKGHLAQTCLIKLPRRVKPKASSNGPTQFFGHPLKQTLIHGKGFKDSKTEIWNAKDLQITGFHF
jgi:hypothetical protein